MKIFAIILIFTFLVDGFRLENPNITKRSNEERQRTRTVPKHWGRMTESPIKISDQVVKEERKFSSSNKQANNGRYVCYCGKCYWEYSTHHRVARSPKGGSKGRYRIALLPKKELSVTRQRNHQRRCR